MHPKILLVDDREDNLFSLETILGNGSYRFVKACSGVQALKILLHEFDFALILMDVRMPDLNGFETATLIYEREKLRHIPIIFITADSAGEEDMFKGYRSGAVDYIHKPVNPELLRAKVAVYIELYRKNRKLLEQDRRLSTINRSLQNEIYERKISEEKIRELNRELLENISRLESANKDLDRFVFMASHDLQEPLRKVRVFADRLLLKCSNKLEEEEQVYLHRMQRACEGMQALINDILTFSRISDDKASFSTCNLNDLLGELLKEMEEAVLEKKASIHIDPLPQLYVNPVLIRTVFFNLIQNALKYSKKQESPVINIRSETSALPEINGRENRKTYCRIFVEDNGIGFDQKYADQVFEMFRRLHPKTETEGTGVGLALCKKIVEKHHGSITAKSKTDEGSVFTISLPLPDN